MAFDACNACSNAQLHRRSRCCGGHRGRTWKSDTIDAVDCPGYAEASKVYIAGNEGLSFEFDPKDHIKELANALGCESIEDQQLLDMLQVDRVSIASQIHGILDTDTNTVLDSAGNRHNIFHTIFGR